jgi:phage-related protein
MDTENKKTVKLGDGYIQSSFTHNSDRAVWQSTSILGSAEMTVATDKLNNYAGGVAFLWRFSPNDPLKPFTCKSFVVTRLVTNTWKIDVNFEEYRSGL